MNAITKTSRISSEISPTTIIIKNLLRNFECRKMTFAGTMKWHTALVDLSGTLHIEDQIIPGSPEALEKLRNAGLKLKFVTNTTKESKNFLYNKLIKLGFKLEKDEIFTSLTAARSVIEEKKLRPFLLLEDCAMEDFAGIETNDPNAVVVGLAPSKFNYDYLNKAFDLLLNGASLVAIHKGRYYKKADKKLHLGPGPFVASLEYATGVVAEVVGKPESKFFHSAIRSLEPSSSPSVTSSSSSLSGVVMIGDDVRDDIIGAIRAGLTGILVKTGKYRTNDENICPDVKPNFVFDDFSEAVDFIIGNK